MKDEAEESVLRHDVYRYRLISLHQGTEDVVQATTIGVPSLFRTSSPPLAISACEGQRQQLLQVYPLTLR